MGLAKPLSKRDELSETFAGTPLAMAPELINGNQYGFKADIWSLGCLLYQLLTGAHPFKGRNFTELKSKLKTGDYKIPRNIPVSFDCTHFLNECLRYDQQRRPDYHNLLDHMFIVNNPSTDYLDLLYDHCPSSATNKR